MFTFYSLLLCSLAQSQEQESITVLSVNTNSKEGVLFLDANIDYALSDRELTALHSGIELAFQTEIKLLKNRTFWLDEEVARLTQDYLLTYNVLTERYSLENLNSRELSTFTNVTSALNLLGRVSRFPVIDESLLDIEAVYFIEVRSLLKIEVHSSLLRFLNIFGSNISIESDWFEWQVN
jgi:hypothetical protein